MTLNEAVERYISRKQNGGLQFERGASYLRRFADCTGDRELSEITVDQTAEYLNQIICATVTWVLKYQVLLRFFEYLEARGEITKFAMPPARPNARQAFVPYIFTRSELKKLLDSVEKRDEARTSINSTTLRTLVLLMYSTGALTGEVLHLKVSDFDSELRTLALSPKLSDRYRQIPVSVDLKLTIDKYLTWRSRKQLTSPYLLVTKHDGPISPKSLSTAFRNVCSAARIVRDIHWTYQPRLLDLKYTFAVHRITTWIKSGANLNRLLPSLAAYMGQSGIGSTERYLAMTPDRFRKDLAKLSQSQRRKHWRDNPELMKFLRSLQECPMF